MLTNTQLDVIARCVRGRRALSFKTISALLEQAYAYNAKETTPATSSPPAMRGEAIQAEACEDIRTFASRLIFRACDAGDVVCGKFNGHILSAGPFTIPSTIIAQWDAAQRRSAEHNETTPANLSPPPPMRADAGEFIVAFLQRLERHANFYGCVILGTHNGRTFEVGPGAKPMEVFGRGA